MQMLQFGNLSNRSGLEVLIFKRLKFSILFLMVCFKLYASIFATLAAEKQAHVPEAGGMMSMTWSFLLLLLLLGLQRRQSKLPSLRLRL